MSTRSLRRATMDFGRLQEHASKGAGTILSAQCADAHGKPTNGDVFHWRVRVMPPDDSLYAGAFYDLLFALSKDEYPFKAPTVRVLTSILNPAVSAEGLVCEGLLQNDNWKPTIGVIDVVTLVVNAVFVNFKDLPAVNEKAAEAFSWRTPEELKKLVQSIRAADKSK